MTTDWRHNAACRTEDPELFFPVGNSGPALAQISEAKAVCRRCPVASTCLTWALETGQDAGVWGGMSEDERRALTRRVRRRDDIADKPVSGVDAEQLALVMAGDYRRGDRTVRREAVYQLYVTGEHTVFEVSRRAGYNTQTTRSILRERGVLRPEDDPATVNSSV